MPNQIKGNIKKERVHKVLELSNKYELEFYKKNVNREYEVVTELRKNGICIGYTSNYIPVIIKERNNNKIVNVRIDEVKSKKYMALY